MSDFFTRLAGRTLEREPVIQPLIPPEFVLGAADVPEAHRLGGPGSGEWEKSEAARGEKTPQERGLPTLSSAPPEPLPAMTAEQRSLHLRASLEPKNRSRASVRDRGRQDFSADQKDGIEPSRRRQAVRGSIGTSDAARSRHGQGDEIRKTLTPVRDRSWSVGTASDARRKDASTLAAPVPRRKREPPIPKHTIEREPDTSSAHGNPLEATGREGTGSGVTAEPEGHARVPRVLQANPVLLGKQRDLEWEETRPAAAERTSQRPAVRVTIGRVEVRAVLQTASPPQPAAAPRGPALSLDDYLRRRNGGG